MNQYDGVDMHRRMVGDRVRTTAFRDSILATVRRGDVVLDVGAGSGILSLFAVQAGAAKVYAVEREPGAAALAHRLAQDNGADDVVEVIGLDVERAVLPTKVDVLVSEWLGAYGVDENLLAPVLLARDRWLRPGGAMIPGAVTAWIAPVAHPAAAAATAFHGRPWGLDLSALAANDADEPLWLPDGVTSAQLCAEPVELWTVQPSAMPLSEAVSPFAARVRVRLDAGGVNGLATWFTAEMPGAAPLRTSPADPPTHWGHFVFPVVSLADALPGDVVELGFHNVPMPAGGSHHLWSVHDGGTILEAHDSRRLARAPGEPPWRVVDPMDPDVRVMVDLTSTDLTPEGHR